MNTETEIRLAKLNKKLKSDPARVARENDALHKTNAFLAEQARRVERDMERARFSR